jgi:hypothetical protein
MAKRNENQLEALWDALVDTMKQKLSGDGEGVTAADLNVIRQFLKDQGIAANMANPKDRKKVAGLIAELNMDDPDEVAASYN